MITLSPGWLGAARGLGFVLLTSALMWFGNSANLAFIGNPTIAMLISTVALAIEHAFSTPGTGGTAMFGMVRKA